MLDWFDRQSIIDLLNYYGLHADVDGLASSAFPLLQEKIAGDARLKGLDGNRRKAMKDVNRILLEDLIADLDEAQTKYEETVAMPWMGFDGMVVALFIHYATVYALLHRAKAEDIAKQLGRSFQVDLSYLRKWIDSKEEQSDEQKANRAKLYTGNSRGTFFQAYEVTQAKAYPHGWVALYQTRDDAHVCADCNDAAGYYLLTQGPFPGRVCRGRARCRCKRLIVWNPTQHKLLTGAVDVKGGWTW